MTCCIIFVFLKKKKIGTAKDSDENMTQRRGDTVLDFQIKDDEERRDNLVRARTRNPTTTTKISNQSFPRRLKWMGCLAFKQGESILKPHQFIGCTEKI